MMVTQFRAVLGVAAGVLLHSIGFAASPNIEVFKAFLSCDAAFYAALGAQGVRVPTLTPLKRNAQGVTYLAVANRLEEEGQTLALNPPYTVEGVAFIEFVDEITHLESRKQTPHYWGFNTEATLAQVLPVVQKLLPKKRKLTVDGKTWARMDVFEGGKWHHIPDHSTLKGQPASMPERALIVETHEGGGTRVMCGVQAAPLPRAELLRLRPDLAP